MHYKNFKRFIERAKERAFNDALMRLIFVSIKNQKTEIPHYMILPRYRGFSLGDIPRKGEHLHCWYQGHKYEYSTFIVDYMPKKALQEAELLLQEAVKNSFKKYSEIANWIHQETQIALGHLSSLGLEDDF